MSWRETGSSIALVLPLSTGGDVGQPIRGGRSALPTSTDRIGTVYSEWLGKRGERSGRGRPRPPPLVTPSFSPNLLRTCSDTIKRFFSYPLDKAYCTYSTNHIYRSSHCSSRIITASHHPVQEAIPPQLRQTVGTSVKRLLITTTTD